MQKRRVVITGMGLVSPLSCSLEGFWDALISGRSGIRPLIPDGDVSYPVSVASPAPFSGTIDDFDAADAGQRKAIRKGLKVMSREIQMAVAASCSALKHADIGVGQFPADRVGISFGSDYILSTVEDVIDGIRSCCRRADDGRTFEFSRWATDGLPKMPPLWQLKYLPNMPSSHIAILNNFHGPSNSMTLREASIGAAVGESAAIIASGRTDLMLVGTTGSRIHPVKMISAVQQEELAPETCRPFDRDRRGTVLGEGAGALVLEELEHAEKRGAAIWAEVVAGAYRARYDGGKTDQRRRVIGDVLRDVLRRGGLEPESIGHINAHGLGSRASDHAEALAIHDLFGSSRGTGAGAIPVTAAKGFFGNLGAGAGTVELIAGVLALQKGVLFPTLGYAEPDPDIPVRPVTGSETPSGRSLIKIALNHQAQASAVLLRRV